MVKGKKSMLVRKIRKGLTLIETVVVVSILGLLISMTITSLMNFVMPSSKEVTDKFSASLYFCYQTAILSNLTVVMDIDIDKGKYSIYKLVRGDGGVEKKKLLDNGFPFNNKLINITDIRGVKYESGIFRIPFTYDGISEDYNFHIGNDNEIKRTVQLYKYNGRIEVKNGLEDRSSGADPAENVNVPKKSGSSDADDHIFEADEKYE